MPSSSEVAITSNFNVLGLMRLAIGDSNLRPPDHEAEGLPLGHHDQSIYVEEVVWSRYKTVVDLEDSLRCENSN
jgi:hypothetical protein